MRATIPPLNKYDYPQVDRMLQIRGGKSHKYGGKSHKYGGKFNPNIIYGGKRRTKRTRRTIKKKRGTRGGGLFSRIIYSGEELAANLIGRNITPSYPRYL